MKNKIILGITICILIIGVIIFIKKPFNSNLKEPKENINDEIIGKWNTVSAVNSETGEKTESLQDVFGSSYLQFGSYLELKEDGTFVDAIQPITNGSRSNTGKYTVKRDYNKQGDYYVFLSYTDGNEEKLQKVILDDSNTSYLVLERFINDYQLTLKKE